MLSHLLERGREKKDMIEERKTSKQLPTKPTASSVGSCSTIRVQKVTQHHHKKKKKKKERKYKYWILSYFYVFFCFEIVGSVGSPTVSSTTISSVELSLSPGDADQTLMRIPESQVGL